MAAAGEGVDQLDRAGAAAVVLSDDGVRLREGRQQKRGDGRRYGRGDLPDQVLIGDDSRPAWHRGDQPDRIGAMRDGRPGFRHGLDAAYLDPGSEGHGTLRTVEIRRDRSKFLPTTDAKTRMPSFVLEERYPDRIRLFTVDHDVRKALEPNAPEDVALKVKRELAWSGLHCGDARPEFPLEPIRQVRSSLGFVVGQGLIEIFLDGRMKLDPHAERRWTPAQKAFSVNGRTSPLSSSASRRTASAKISLGPAGIRGAGKLPRILSAR